MQATQTTTLTSSASSQVSHPIPTLNPESSEFYQQFREIKANSPDRINRHQIQNSALNALEELTPKQRASMPLFEGACATYTKLIMSDMNAALHPDNVNSLGSEEKKAMFLKLMTASQHHGLPQTIRDDLKNIIVELNKLKAFRKMDLKGVDLSGIDLSDLDLLDTIFHVPTLYNLAFFQLQQIPTINPETSQFCQVFAAVNQGTSQQLVGFEALNKMTSNQLATMPLFDGACDEYVKLVMSSMRAALTPTQTTHERIAFGMDRTTIKTSYENLGSPAERGQVFVNLIKASRHTSLSKTTRLALLDMVNDLDARRAFRKLDLRGADLQGMDLSSLTLNGSDLSGANLSNANLSNIELKNANMSGANMSYASLNNAFLIKANMSKTNLTRANMSHAEMNNANMSEAILIYAKMVGASLHNTELQDANLMGANLTQAKMKYAKLIKANLTSADMSKTIMYFANLTDANLTDANLTEAAMYGSKLIRTTITNADITLFQLRAAATTEGMINDEWYGALQNFVSSFAK